MLSVGERRFSNEVGSVMMPARQLSLRLFCLMNYLPFLENAARIMLNFARLTRGTVFIFILANNLITGHPLRIQMRKFVAFRHRMLLVMLSYCEYLNLFLKLGSKNLLTNPLPNSLICWHKSQAYFGCKAIVRWPA